MPGAINAATATGAVQAHIRSKEALMELLRARALDKGAFVRQRALQARTRARVLRVAGVCAAGRRTQRWPSAAAPVAPPRPP